MGDGLGLDAWWDQPAYKAAQGTLTERGTFATIVIAGVALLAFSGCVTTLREVRSQTPVLTTAAHRAPATFLACVREHIEEHHPYYQGGYLRIPPRGRWRP